MDITAWALMLVAALLIAAMATVLIVSIVMKGTASRDRATVLKAVADVLRAMHGRRR
jgi:flagellar biosynthesis protein FliQ